jgi:hypothetical protein
LGSDFLCCFSIVVLMVIGIITAQSVLNGVTMKETVAQKPKCVTRLKELELTPCTKQCLASGSSLSARYP